MAVKYDCTEPTCRKQVTATKNQRYRTHTNREGDPCANSSEVVPEHILAQPVGEDDSPEVPREGVDFAVCVSCDRKVTLTKLGYFEEHTTTLMGGERCPTSGVHAKHAKKVVDVHLPGDAATSEPAASTPRAEAAADASEDASLEEPGRSNLERHPMATLSPEVPATAAGSSASTGGSSPESGTTWNGLPPYDGPPSRYGVKSGRFWQPGSPYLQPSEWLGSPKPEPMSGLANDLATMIKETFYSYSNRKSSDNRTAQTTLGPSEVGTPCDRRLAMELLNIPYVNAGGDGWAAWTGTQMHNGMADIYTFANAGTGRYAIEFRVKTPSMWVPGGTSDLLDRRIHTIIDWKMMGAYSLKKFKLEGPSETYQVQAHVYGLGAENAGEKVKNVAVVGLPRAGSSLDEMHVWAESYDRKRAEAALARVDAIAAKVQESTTWGGLDVVAVNLKRAAQFNTADVYECRYCPFLRKGDDEMEMGCPGV